MEISFVVTALQLFIIVPGIFLASYLAFVSPSDLVDTFISLDQNVRAKISKNILHIGIIAVLSFVIYFSFGTVLLVDSSSWFKKGEYRTIFVITIFHFVMTVILLFLLYYIYRNQRLKFLLKGTKEKEVEVDEEEIADDEEMVDEEEKKEKEVGNKENSVDTE